MTDNINIETLSNFFFVNTMDCILQDLYGYSDISIYWILGLSFFLHAIFLRKNEALLEMIQSLQTSKQLADSTNNYQKSKVS